MSFEAGQLVLRQDPSVTCPKCSNEFSLDQGCAKKALDQLSEASADAIATMREADQSEVENRAQQLANEKARAAQNEAESLKSLLKDQSEAHAKALAEVRNLAEKSVAALLAVGYEIQSVATRLGISVNTVRIHVKAIFWRTRIRSQAKLNRRITGGAAALLRD
jgi:DNA-binding NarL/FixJ family response regulator